MAAKTRFKSVDKMWLFSFLEMDGLTVIFDTLNTLAKQKVNMWIEQQLLIEIALAKYYTNCYN